MKNDTAVMQKDFRACKRMTADIYSIADPFDIGIDHYYFLQNDRYLSRSHYVYKGEGATTAGR